MTSTNPKRSRPSEGPRTLQAKRLEELEALYRISQSMQSLDLDKILRQILEGVTRTVGFDRARLYIVHPKRKQLVLKMAVGIKKNSVGALTLPLRPENSVAARAVMEKRPLVVSDTQQDPRVNPELVRMFGTKAFAVVPFVARNRQVRGVVAADNLHSGRTIEEESLRRLSTFANQAALAIENANAHTQLKHFNRQLRQRVAHAKDELLRTQEQLIQSEKLAALGELSAGIAHEIRNPLTSISLLVHSLTQRLASENQDVVSDFGLMQGEIERLNNIVTQFLEYARPASPQLDWVDAHEILAQARGLLVQKFHAKKLQWHDECARDVPRIHVDKYQMQQVFINLALNALAALSQKGTGLTVGIGGNEAGVFVRFQDDGPGISKADLRKLFVPFFTTKAKGLGLGLSIAQRIVASHKGTLTVASRLGKGACFTVTLPLPPKTNS